MIKENSKASSHNKFKKKRAEEMGLVSFINILYTRKIGGGDVMHIPHQHS